MMAWRRPFVPTPADHETAHRDALEDCLLPMTCQPGGRVKDENSPRSIASSILVCIVIMDQRLTRTP